MQTNVELPQLELNMASVVIASVRVRVGERVAVHQPLMEVESEKAVTEVPSPIQGWVRRILVAAGDRVEAKATLCVLTDAPDVPFDEPQPAKPSVPAVPGRVDLGGAPDSPADPSTSEIVRAAPAARKRAKDLGVALEGIRGTGPGGRITVDDVDRRFSAGAPPPQGSDWVPLPASRRALIAEMQRSLTQIPQFHVGRHFQVGPLLQKGGGITFMVRLIAAVAVALVKHPVLRTMIAGDKVRIAPVSVAVAISTPRGLIAPALRAGDLVGLESIASRLKDLRERAGLGTLRREEWEEAPFAVSNLGRFNVESFQPFVFHGQTAVLGVGRAAEDRAWFNLAADHRVVDGVEAAGFLESLQEEILRP